MQPTTTATTTLTSTLLLLLTATTSALPAPFPDPSTETYYYPATLGIHSSNNGSITYDSPQGRISRHSTNNGADLSTLMTFYFNSPSSEGKTCEFMFELDGPAPYTFEPETSPGTKGKAKPAIIDVFESLLVGEELEGPREGWISGKGNKRGKHLGSLEVREGGQAEVVEGKRVLFPCPGTDAGVARGWEVVGRGAEVEVGWGKTDGAWIRYF